MRCNTEDEYCMHKSTTSFKFHLYGLSLFKLEDSKQDLKK